MQQLDKSRVVGSVLTAAAVTVLVIPGCVYEEQGDLTQDEEYVARGATPPPGSDDDECCNPAEYPTWCREGATCCMPGQWTCNQGNGQNVCRDGEADQCDCGTASSMAGLEDDFAPPWDNATPSAALQQKMTICSSGGRVFDQGLTNRCFGHTFYFPSDAYDFQLRMRLRQIGGDPGNDSIGLQLRAGGSFEWSRILWDLPIAGDGSLSLDLSALPLAGGGTADIDAIVGNANYLDLYIQDDTKIDFAELTYTICTLDPGEPCDGALQCQSTVCEPTPCAGEAVCTTTCNYDGMTNNGGPDDIECQLFAADGGAVRPDDAYCLPNGICELAFAAIPGSPNICY